MKNLFALGFLCSAFFLIGMDEEKLDQVSDQLLESFIRQNKVTQRVTHLKSIGGLATICIIHTSGKPLSQYIIVTTRGSILAKGSAEDFHRLLTLVETIAPIYAAEDNDSKDFSIATVSALRIHTSSYARAQKLAAEIPAGQTLYWVFDSIRNIDGVQGLPMIDEAEQTRIIQWAQKHAKFNGPQENNLVSLDAFANIEGTLIYPQKWIPLQEKMARIAPQEPQHGCQ